MAVTSQPSRPALSPMEANLQHQLQQRALRRKRSAVTAPSPLKKQSDYEVVAPLALKPARPVPPAPIAVKKKPQTPGKVAAASKERKKILCSTPPQVLHCRRGRTEYDRGRQLGEGGFARCYLVENKEGKKFAAKTVAKKSLASQKMKDKFFGEIQVHKTMVHPNVVKFVECFEDADNIYMILELCSNKSLMEMLRKRKRFTESEVRYYLLQLLGALKYMHGKRVIHRDLKLGNIFLDENMNMKIGDFGLAALLVDEDERKKTICGTPNYIAPEVLFGSGKEGDGHSFEVDLWAVGVIMYAMLCGRPPFQSEDITSIYKRIRDSNFDWPKHISISSQAKDLVKSLLNRDPTARPSLDKIANHSFFSSGVFPRSIPVEALISEPEWPSITRLDLNGVAAARTEWKRNYEHVAKACGVGIDSTGRPIKSVGAEAGRPLSIIPLPQSRPQTASSTSSGAENDCGDIQKLLQKKKDQAEKKQKEAVGYLLPEALSPRDGHARMRNIQGLSRIPSRLGKQVIAARDVARPPSAVTEESGEDEEGSESEKEVKPVRPLDLKPIRRISTEKAASVESAPVPAATVFPSRRPNTRSHAAQQREPMPAATRVARAVIAKPAAEQPREQLVPMETERPSSSRTDSSGSKAKPATFTCDLIPFKSNLSSRIGRPIPCTATSAVLSSFQPIINNLTAYLTSDLASLPPLPLASTQAILAHRRGQPSTAIFVSKWVDYTNKYGMAYILSDGTCATLFNDNTSLVSDSVSGSKAEWITQSLAASGPGGKEEPIYRRLATDMSVLNERSATSRGLAGKVAVWRRTGNYMTSNIPTSESWSTSPESATREPSFATSATEDEHMLWVTHYARTRLCVVFRLIDGTLQFNFFDHSKIILTSAGRTLRCIGSDHSVRALGLEQAGGQWAEDFGLKRKITYIRELLKQWVRKGRFPRENSPSTTAGKVVVLGEATAQEEEV